MTEDGPSRPTSIPPFRHRRWPEIAELTKTRTPAVYKLHRGKGTVYVARWREVDLTTGKARARSKTLPTEAAARQYRASVEHAQATGTYVPPNVGKVTVREVAEQWLAVAATQVRPRTLENYERGLRLRVLRCPRSEPGASTASQAGTWSGGSRRWGR